MRKLKKLTLLTLGGVALLSVISPYVLTLYVQHRYYKLSNIIKDHSSGIKISHFLRLGYLRSLLISKIQINHDAWFYQPKQPLSDGLINYAPHTIITLEHAIHIVPFSMTPIVIKTKVLTGLPKVIKEHNKFNIVTKVDFKGRILANIDNIKLQYAFAGKEKHVLADKANLNFTDYNNNMQLDLLLPMVTYQENLNKAEIENLHFNLKIRDYHDQDRFRIKLLTEMSKGYLVNKQKVLLKLSNFNMEQKLSSRLSNKISFLKLNILNNKFGPLATKVQLNNISFGRIRENLPALKFPMEQAQLSEYKLIQLANSLLQYKPSVSADLILHLGRSKMNILTDFVVDSQAADWMNTDDILDSLSINLFAKIPKEVTLDLITNIMAMQHSSNSTKKHGSNSWNIGIFSDKKICTELAEEKIKYLIKHNVLSEEGNDFLINVSIAEGTFYSRMNPFKIFSF